MNTKMDHELPWVTVVNGTFKDAESHKWRAPKSPCSPESPPSLMIRGKTLSLTKSEKLKPIKELSKKSRKIRLQQSQAGNLSLLKRRETSPDVYRLEARLRPKREPLPMRMRALPQSFWQEPHNMSTSSMSSGSTFPNLLPLFQNDNNNSEVVMGIRPLTPPEEKERPRPPKEPKLKFTAPPNTDLLLKLFETVEEDKTKKFVVRRGRPKRVQSDLTRHVLPKVEEDPCMISNLANKLFPQLSLENKPSSNAPLHCVSLQDGDKSVILPSINNEKNYSQMLSELVSHY